MPRRRPLTQPISSLPDDNPVIEPQDNDESQDIIDPININNEDEPDEATPEPDYDMPDDLESKSVDTDFGVVETKELPQPVMYEQRREGEPNGLILRGDEPIRIEGKDDGVEIIVKRDVFREVYPSGTRRPTYILLYAKGTRVLKSVLTKL